VLDMDEWLLPFWGFDNVPCAAGKAATLLRALDRTSVCRLCRLLIVCLLLQAKRRRCCGR